MHWFWRGMIAVGGGCVCVGLLVCLKYDELVFEIIRAYLGLRILGNWDEKSFILAFIFALPNTIVGVAIYLESTEFSPMISPLVA